MGQRASAAAARHNYPVPVNKSYYFLQFADSRQTHLAYQTNADSRLQLLFTYRSLVVLGLTELACANRVGHQKRLDSPLLE